MLLAAVVTLVQAQGYPAYPAGYLPSQLMLRPPVMGWGYPPPSTPYLATQPNTPDLLLHRKQVARRTVFSYTKKTYKYFSSKVPTSANLAHTFKKKTATRLDHQCRFLHI